MVPRLDSLVIRGGTIRDPAALKRKVENAIEDGDGPVISVFCEPERAEGAPPMALEVLCRISEVVHSKVQVTTVGRLEEAGFSLELDVSNGQPLTHHHVVVDDPVQESTLQRFIDAFDEPVATPTGGKRRSST